MSPWCPCELVLMLAGCPPVTCCCGSLVAKLTKCYMDRLRGALVRFLLGFGMEYGEIPPC